jgi:predicted transcriptional regulator
MNMSREELKTRINHLVANVESESILEEVLFFLENSSINDEPEIIPGLPRTYEERIAAVDRGMAEHRRGEGMTHEEFLKEIETWKLHGSLKLEKT